MPPTISTSSSPLEAGDIDTARRALDPLRRLYRKWIIGPLEVGVMPNAALKRWCEFVGMAGGSVREPLTELSTEDAVRFDAELREAFQAAQSGAGLIGQR
ncbi:hypothetical protein A5719_21610 [Mycolicibacterium peregrinum]|nr:hypothetical protein A5719_21610 [Mycolicibacterium peregrinum]